ncbi:glycerophosphodiester phosphodiesterase domain-containing protein 1 [Stylonychia lemnae]|uniref:Glycerophosphodiester phosphodiesterase domain-containing protein 1 n=1 Tax=Stylonychia lemnae TaxID=5949 RepID=A0A078A0X0_STYLE|nr:glycerophosphodiester phosphodiesterase domain-containing protein 1 [Stylonychia lemnae]|eukprot:CDW75831.1 glycerophosphodiester phosphodiesterase domain-containing protein 1 [Stylonychia lemnae]
MILNLILAVIGVYNGISYFFLMNPTLLHKYKDKLQLPQPPTNQKKYVLSHRAGAYEKPESTVQAFQHSESIGVHIIETDIQITSDNVLIAYHDEDFIRACGVDAKVIETPSTSLPQLKDSIPIWFSYDDSYEMQSGDSRQIATLSQLFAAVPSSTVIVLELINAENQVAQQQLINLIQSNNRKSTTVIGTIESKYNAQLNARDPTVPIFMPSGKVIQYFLLYVFGLLPFVPISEDFASIPYMSAQYAYARMKNMPSLYSVLYIAVTWIISHLCDNMIKHFNKRGIYTNYYVANLERDIEKIYRGTSAMGVMTDKPTLAINILNKLP